MKKIITTTNGFSLAEVLIVVAIAAALVVVVGGIGSNVASLNGLVGDSLQSKSDIAQTLQIMTSEIRAAEPSAAGAYPIVAAATSSLSFYTDVNDTGKADYVSYYLASGTIYRVVIAPTGTPPTYPTSTAITYDMIDNVSLATSTPLFSYYDTSYTGSGASMSSPIAVGSIRLVSVAFISQTNQNPASPPTPQYFSNLIDMRNLDTN